MPGTISHVLSMTSPNDAAYENQPKHWNSSHLATFNLTGSEISGAFGNGGGITFGLSADGAITAAAPAGAALINFSAGTTSNDLGAVVFANSNGLAFGLNTGASSRSITGSYTQSTHSHATEFLAITLGGNTAGTTTYNASNTNTIFLNGGNNITLSGNAGTITISGPTLTNSSWTVSDTATSATVGRLAFTQANGVTMTLSTSNNGNHTVFASHNGITSQSTQYLAMTLGGNTAGTTTFHATNNASLFFNGGNGITLSGNGSTVTISGITQSVQTVGMYATGNTTHNSSTTFDARTLGTINGLGALTAGYSNGSIELSVPATSSLVGTSGLSVSTNGSTISVFPQPLAAWDHPASISMVTNSTLGQNTIYIAPFDLEWPVSAYRMNFFFSFQASNQSTANSTGSGGLTFSMALYTKDAANTTQLASHLSRSFFINVSGSSGTNFSATNPVGISNSTAVTTSQYGVNNATATNYALSSLNGFRVVPLPISSVLTPGRWWVAVAISTTSGNANQCFIRASVAQMSVGQIAFRNFNAVSAASDASFFNPHEALGSYASTSNAFPANIPLTTDSIRGATAGTVPFFNFSSYTTATNWL